MFHKAQVTPVIAALVITSIAGCSSGPEPVVLAVTGPVPANEMGLTLIHEHVLVDFIGADSTGYQRWDKEEAAERIAPFLTEVGQLGVKTIIECTPAYLGRDPLLLKMLSERTGVQLVTNTGYYGAYGNRYIPESFYGMTARELAGIWIDEFENGIEESGVRPGFIKIAVDPDDTLSPEHIKIVTAAAYTHNVTGLVIASHTGPDKPAFMQIDILKSHGVSPSSFIWVHAQRGTLEGNTRAAKMGTWISLDNVNTTREPEAEFSVEWYAERVVALKKAGCLNRVLLSHDAGWYSVGQENGGEFRGYTGIFKALIPALEALGLTQPEIDQLLIVNPREAFSINI
jgi:phosphotriesterase-related protein